MKLRISSLAPLLAVVTLVTGCAMEEAEAGEAAYPAAQPPIGYTPPPRTPPAVAASQPVPPPPPYGQDGQEAAPPQPDADEVAIGPADEAGGDSAGYADTDPAALTDFHSTLEPYGTWTDDPTYGTVWVPSPSVVGEDFSPYVSAGHWVYDRRLRLGERLRLGLGAVSLRPLGVRRRPRLGVDSRSCLRGRMGVLALWRRRLGLRRLGAAAAHLVLARRPRGRCRLRGAGSLCVRRNRRALRSVAPGAPRRWAPGWRRRRAHATVRARVSCRRERSRAGASGGRWAASLGPSHLAVHDGRGQHEQPRPHPGARVLSSRSRRCHGRASPPGFGGVGDALESRRVVPGSRVGHAGPVVARRVWLPVLGFIALRRSPRGRLRGECGRGTADASARLCAERRRRSAVLRLDDALRGDADLSIAVSRRDLPVGAQLSLTRTRVLRRRLPRRIGNERRLSLGRRGLSWGRRWGLSRGRRRWSRGWSSLTVRSGNTCIRLHSFQSAYFDAFPRRARCRHRRPGDTDEALASKAWVAVAAVVAAVLAGCVVDSSPSSSGGIATGSGGAGPVPSSRAVRDARPRRRGRQPDAGGDAGAGHRRVRRSTRPAGTGASRGRATPPSPTCPATSTSTRPSRRARSRTPRPPALRARARSRNRRRRSSSAEHDDDVQRRRRPLRRRVPGRRSRFRCS